MLSSKYLKDSVVILFVILAGLFLIKIFDISYPITIVTTTKSSELSVIGEGKVDVIPDTAHIDAGISVTNGSTPVEVQQSIDTVNNKIIAALQKLGIRKEDVTTSNYSINPNYEFVANQNRVVGYNGNVNISIKVKNVQMVSPIIQEVTKAGANQIQGARFTVDNPEKYRELARTMAIKNAKTQAQKLAKTLGIRLGKITNIIESSPSQGPIVYPMAKFEAGIGGAGGPQIEPGSQTISSVVTLFFEKK